MTTAVGIVGQVLDSKYKIDKQLGKGGMGTVYLSTHIGTGRPVAVKVIAPDFMKRSEFVERFRREAKAAGRLRHPNVVDVTDFGFAKTESGETVAYLVMEYLDGCTLGEVLEEEKKLPVSFMIDILEQVCSAVEEAHRQGIIHRDLKPDNIWLEPNQRGGYTVKVLDFGIAKLEETQEISGSTASPRDELAVPGASNESENAQVVDRETVADNRVETLVDEKNNRTLISEGETMALVEKTETLIHDSSEAGTIIQPAESKKSAESSAGDEKKSSQVRTTALPADRTRTFENEDAKGTRLISPERDAVPLARRGSSGSSSSSSSGGATDQPALNAPSTSDLTRVGAVLGTPLYMSPEQCRGEKLTNRSDIYSLAVIVYQMLSGKLPFTGDYLKVMDGHKNEEPPPLDAKKAPKKLKKIVMQALAKNPAERADSAEAFANKIRANSEGIGVLLRRSLIIYTENLPKFLQLTLLTFLPLILVVTIKTVYGLAVGFDYTSDGEGSNWIVFGFEILYFFVSIITSAFLVGMMTWVVAQYLAYPLRPLSLRSAFSEARRKAKSLSLTVGLSTIVSTIGFLLCILPGVFLSAKFMLIAPSIMMEGVRGKAAFRRSMELTKRSFRTVLATSVLVYVIPFTLGILIASFIGLANTAFVQTLQTKRMNDQIEKMKKEGVAPQPDVKPREKGVTISLGGGDGQIKIEDEEEANEESGNKNEAEKTKEETEESKKIKSYAKRFNAVTQTVSQIVLIPTIIILASISSVITALLYFKTRQAGGESMQELLGKLDARDEPQSKWQERVRERLIQSGRLTGTTSSNTGGNTGSSQ